MSQVVRYLRSTCLVRALLHARVRQPSDVMPYKFLFMRRAISEHRGEVWVVYLFSRREIQGLASLWKYGIGRNRSERERKSATRKERREEKRRKKAEKKIMKGKTQKERECFPITTGKVLLKTVDHDFVTQRV